jgi:multiple sugar transport system permease protein
MQIAPVAAPKKPFWTIGRSRALWAWLMLLVPMLFFLLFRIGPTLFAFNVGFRDWDILSDDKPWVGLQNFALLMKDPVFRKSMGNTLIYMGVGVPAQVLIGLGIALLLHRINRFRGLFRVIYFIPYITSTVAVSWVWRWMFMKNFGVINNILSFLHLPNQDFLGSTSQAIYSIITVAVWQGMGFQMLIFLAGLEGIPRQFYEAAEIDGANRWRLLRHITVPLLNPVIIFSVIIGSIRYLQIFAEVLNMSSQGQGGPLNATKSLVLFIYQEGFQRFRMGYASAATVVLFLVIITLTVVQMRLISRKVEY